MKALILAAGFGKRLRPLTDTIPKPMVEVNGVPLLVNALNNLVDCKVYDIGIVVGHMADYIRERIGSEYRGAKITYFENERYLETNNVVSLYVARQFLDDDVLLLEADLFYRKNLIEALLNTPVGECSILVSPFNPEIMDGTIVQVDEDNHVQSLILGKWQKKDEDYTAMKKTVNLYRFSREFVQNKYMPLIEWYVEHMGENSYYEKVLGALLYLRECEAKVVEVPETEWCEVDDLEDLERARKNLCVDRLQRQCNMCYD